MSGQSDRTPRTEAGRRHWESIAENERLSTNGVRMSMYREAILAIEDEASAAPPQPPDDVERLRIEADQAALERLRGWIADHRRECPIMQAALASLHEGTAPREDTR